MRRTYRSKKDVSGALDHRDMYINMDEKSSAFDAFYIQNIKQTKREISCVGTSNQFGVASNKVRKRKYVKRIVKEVEPVYQRETMSPTAYLTPDKSIRVNKVLDPFDMLLDSSPARHDVPKIVKENTFNKILPKKEGKTYTRKKLPRVKKCNFSNTDSSESDKENIAELQTNLTDIRTHELVVERELSASPKYHDESINKIVNNLSLLHNLKQKTPNSSFNTSFRHRSRLTKNYQSPILQKSPLCSTPFKEKYRGASIYKFSPISQKGQGVSPSSVSIAEENDGSIVFVGKEEVSRASLKYQISPLTHLPKISFKNMPELIKDKQEDMSKLNINEILDNENKEEDSETQIANDDNSILNIEHSSFQNTEAEPFLGFSVLSEAEVEHDEMLLVKCLEQNNSIQEENMSVQENNDKELETDKYNKNDYANILQQSLKSNRSLQLDNNSIQDAENEFENSQSDDRFSNVSENSVNSNKCNASQSSLESQSDIDSFYNTCSSEQSSSEDDCKNKRVPIVAMKRLSDSIFMKYYAKMQIEQDELSLSTDYNDDDDDDFVSLANDSNEEQLNTSDTSSIENKPNTIVITDSSTTEDVASSNDESEPNEDEKCISFVTTRRRNELTNDSLFLFDNSYGSSTTDCDKTVLSNKANLAEKSDLEIAIDNDEVNVEPNLVTTEKDFKNYELKMSESPILACTRFSRITTRKSSRKSKVSSPKLDASRNDSTFTDKNEAKNDMIQNSIDSKTNSYDVESINSRSSVTIRKSSSMFNENSTMSMERSSYAGSESKPIVLKPGKKWERSLSIYRRMTMVTDNFNQSILDDESQQRKGRKYRQSVISTMELQDFRDSLHNESINSRRSTFVSRPSRPTIRFVIDPNNSIVSLNTTSVFDDLKGFLNEECDDTLIELSKLSIADSEHEITVLEKFLDTERVTTARDYVLRRCNQTDTIPFDECYPETVLKNCHKIGEGVYGEVFLWRARDGRARVMKIVPIAGTVKVNGEDQKDFHEIISEIVIAMEVSALRAPIAEFDRQLDEGRDIHALDLHAVENATDVFNEVLAVRCVFGPYPSRLLDLWDLYDESKGSENDNPASLPADQQYIVLELANAGQDLESYQFANAQQAHALFQQVAFGLAVAEEAFQFEHRDLHWGNVLIAPTEQKLATFILRGRPYRVPRCGVAATIIDYSLSRLSLPQSAEQDVLYNDLARDEQLFDAVGDYQFEVYRLMREKLSNEWKNFEPYTNIIWLHYTVDKMITALRYKRTNTKIHKHYIEKLKGIKDRILEYGSAVQYVLTDIEI